MKKLLISAILFLFFVSCEERTRVIMSTERHLVDSAYLVRIDSAKELIDSICIAMKETDYTRILDSIIQERIAEIEKLHSQ